MQRQAERIKREKSQAKTKRGDDCEPTDKPESLVPVARFQGSRLASGPLSSPYQQKGSRAQKVARIDSGATIGAAIVEAESSLESEVCSFLKKRHFNVISIAHHLDFPLIYCVNAVS